MALVDNEELSQGNTSEIEAVEQQQTQAAAETQAPKIPDKYRGKSVEEIVHMHQEAEKLIGRQAQEVGDLRKLADDFLKQQLSVKAEQKPAVEESEIDFFEDPRKAVQKAVESHPDVLAAKQAATEFKRMQTQAKLAQKHPDFTQVVGDGEFIEWVKGSPIRLNMFAMADAQFDYDAADELISTFKQIRSTKTQQTKTDGQEVLKQNLKAASVDVGGTGEAQRKIYRRADLIRLRMTDPARYEALEPEIRAAYAEGRVR
jgi:hypothetical protein